MSVSSTTSSDFPSPTLMGMPDNFLYSMQHGGADGIVVVDSMPPSMNVDCGEAMYALKDMQGGAQGHMMTTFSIAKRPRKTRAKFSKVRTGCITCKRRHVKCDEAKPSCNRCIKWGGVCHGYEDPASRSNTAPESRGTSPNASATGEINSPPGLLKAASSPSSDTSWEELTPSPRPPMQHAPPPPSQDVFNEAFWKDVVPSLVKRNAAVRYANLAVHALILAKQPSLDQSRTAYGKNQYGGALSFYGLALREVRQASAIQGDLRAAILCSMFFVIFEILNGDRLAADAHLYNGRRMLAEFLQAQQPATTGTPASEGDSLRRELRNFLRYLALQYGSLLDIDCSTYGEGEGSEFLEELVQGEFYSRISVGNVSRAVSSSVESSWGEQEMEFVFNEGGVY